MQVAANGHSLRLIGPGFDPSSPGSLEAGVGSPNLNITDGTLCDDMSVAPARLAAPGFDFASYLVPAFQTGARPVKGSCRPARTLKGPARPVSFSLDAHGVVVDGVTLPFGPAAKPVNHVALGSRYADGTLNLSIDWADGSSFHAEREIGGDAFAMFGFTLHGRPDADMQTCRVAP